MIDFPQQPAAIVEKAGKRTAILQLVSIGLLFVLTFLYVDVSSRQTKLYDGVHENAMWAVYQLDREIRNVSKLADLALKKTKLDQQDIDGILLRFDILLSRADLLDKPGFEAFFNDQAEIADKEKNLMTELSAVEPLFQKLDTAGAHLEPMQQINDSLARLEAVSNELLLTANSISTVNRAQKRESVSGLQQLIAVFVALLLVSIGILIVTLQRQLTSVRAAGASLEEMARKLADAYQAADAGNRAKSQFMATMGHEIRTPLNAILGTAELLELSSLSPDIRTNVHTIRSSGEALLEVLNEILDYSKIEHGKLEIEAQSVNVAQLADTVASIMSGRAREHGNRIVLDLPERLQWQWVKTDPTRLRQILLNLTSNAIKFTNEGTVTLRFRERSGPNGRKILRFEVIDTGIGIDEEGQKKLFQPFSQVDASISRRFGGTGLGLTICKEITERLGGQIGVSSDVGKGSIFWLELPVELGEAANDEVGRAHPANLVRLPELKILLAEDNKVNQQIILRFLERLGQHAAIANNGEEAVNMSRKTAYDLILMDMQMPVMDGIQAARRIRAGEGMNAGTHIFALTANASDDDRRDCLNAGMNGFELKPVSLTRLHGILAQVAANGRGIENIRADASNTDDKVADVAGTRKKGLDLARRAELCEALGEDVYKELLDSFFADATVLLKDLQDAARSGDEAGVDRVLHTIKGAAANVGFGGIAELAQFLRTGLGAESDIQWLELIIDEEKSAIAA